MTAANFLAIMPEILLVVLAGLILVVDLLLTEERKGALPWVTAGGLLIIIMTSLASMPGANPEDAFGGMVRHDWMSYVFKMLFLFGAALTCLLTSGFEKLDKRGEFYVLLLVSTLGMNLMASAGDLVMLYLAIETTSIPLYVLAGFLTHNVKSTESGFKYLLFGAMTSTLMLYGFSLLYGFSGTTSLAGVAASLQNGGLPNIAVMGSLVLVLIGFGFKVSAFPLHFWAPDVYEGAPTPVAGFLSTASKAAGFAVLARVLLDAYSPSIDLIRQWSSLLSAMAVATMTIGNLLALTQKNIKRLLAYSSIAHAGYILIGVVSATQLGISSAVFYLIAYLATNLAAFGTVAAASKVLGSDDIASYAGLSRRSPGLALAMLVAFLSLSGMPPFGGFVTKVFLFAAAIDAGLIWLAVVGVLNSIIGLYYYLTVLKVVYLYRSDNDEQPLPLNRAYSLALGILTVAILLVGTMFGPFYSFATAAAQALF